jgi:hypothetical protein
MNTISTTIRQAKSYDASKNADNNVNSVKLRNWPKMQKNKRYVNNVKRNEPPSRLNTKNEKRSDV